MSSVEVIVMTEPSVFVERMIVGELDSCTEVCDGTWLVGAAEVVDCEVDKDEVVEAEVDAEVGAELVDDDDDDDKEEAEVLDVLVADVVVPEVVVAVSVGLVESVAAELLDVWPLYNFSV